MDPLASLQIEPHEVACIRPLPSIESERAKGATDFVRIKSEAAGIEIYKSC